MGESFEIQTYLSRQTGCRTSATPCWYITVRSPQYATIATFLLTHSLFVLWKHIHLVALVCPCSWKRHTQNMIKNRTRLIIRDTNLHWQSFHMLKMAVMRNKHSSNQCLFKIRLLPHECDATTSLNSQTWVQPMRIGHVFQRLSFSPASFAGIIHTKESGKVQTGNV